MASSFTHDLTSTTRDLDQLDRNELAVVAEQYAEQVQASFTDSQITEIDLKRVYWRASSQLCQSGAYCETQLDDPPTHTVVLSYPGYQAWGWAEMTGVIRHELAHAVVNEQYGSEVRPHGPEFQQVAESLDAPMRGEEPVPYRYKLFCQRCGSMIDGLYKASDRTKNPWNYTSSCCQARLQVETTEDCNNIATITDFGGGV